jgi:hypothetical protein
MSGNSNLKMSHGYEVLRPKNDQALPIPCNEWDFLKCKISGLTSEPWLFQMIGSTLVAAALATAISIWTGAVSSADVANAVVVAWAVAAVCAITGAACLFFAQKERQVHRAKASDVLTQMKLIEERFEREGF